MLVSKRINPVYYLFKFSFLSMSMHKI